MYAYKRLIRNYSTENKYNYSLYTILVQAPAGPGPGTSLVETDFPKNTLKTTFKIGKVDPEAWPLTFFEPKYLSDTIYTMAFQMQKKFFKSVQWFFQVGGDRQTDTSQISQHFKNNAHSLAPPNIYSGGIFDRPRKVLDFSVYKPRYYH